MGGDTMTHFDMELTQRQAKEYLRVTKKQKGKIISQYCKLTHVSRNLASKRFRKVIRDIHPLVLKNKHPTGKKRGRKPKFTSIHKAIIKKAWELSGEICGERLHPIIGEYIDQLEENGKLKYYGKRYIKESKEVSQRTLRRIIAQYPKVKRKKSRRGNPDIYKTIPIKAYFGKYANEPGNIEIDYVEHNGGNARGQFAVTGSYVDIYLQWFVRRASLGKSMQSVKDIHDKNEKKILHQVQEYHADNDRCILSYLLEKKLNPKRAGFGVSRSRPYHKEDNGHVEQKNGDKVRKLVGYHRYDTREQVRLLNQLYEIEDLISNFFLPSQKMVEKIKDEKGRVIGRRHDTAKTAYQRLMEAKEIKQEVKNQARQIYESLNLVELREKSERIQEKLFQTVISKQ